MLDVRQEAVRVAAVSGVGLISGVPGSLMLMSESGVGEAGESLEPTLKMREYDRVLGSRG